MAIVDFAIPHKLEDLLDDDSDTYYVRQTVDAHDLPGKIREARNSYQDEGAQYILEYFDTYFSAIYQENAIDIDKLLIVYNDLRIAVEGLTQNLKFLLDDKDNLTDEVKLKYQAIMKMLLYLFCSLIVVFQKKEAAKDMQLLTKKKGRKRTSGSDDDEVFNKESALVTLNMFLQCDLHFFWDPPVVEEQLINAIAEVAFRMLENASISSTREIRSETFNVFGVLLMNYSYDESFVIRLVQILKVHGHLVNCVAEGIQTLVRRYNAKGLVGEFIHEIMEFLMDEKADDNEGIKNTTTTLLELSKLLPDLMMPEIVYLNNYLGHDSHSLRGAILNVMSEVLLVLGSKVGLSDNEKELKELLPTIVLEHVNDNTPAVRGKAIQILARLHKENLLTVNLQNDSLDDIVLHLSDKAAAVRKIAANCVCSYLQHNSFGADLSLKEATAELETRTKQLQTAEDNIKQKLGPEKLNEVEADWNAIEPEIAKIIEDNVKTGKKKKNKKKTRKSKENDDNAGGDKEADDNNDEDEDDADKDEEDDDESEETGKGDETEPEAELVDVASDQILPLIRMYMEGKQYKDALIMCKKALAEIEETQEQRQAAKVDDAEFFLNMLKNIFHQNALQIEKLVDVETVLNMNEMQESVNYYKQVVQFLQVLDNAMPNMKLLLTSVNVTEMQEAVKFFVTAYQFKLDSSELRVLEMLDIMKLPFQDRKDIVVKALIEIFLTTTSTSNIKEHVKTIVERLIRIVRIVPYDKRASFQSLITQWASTGKLDNNVLEMFFSYYTKTEPVTDDQSLAALQVLTMAAHGRKTIVTNNLNMVSEIVFQRRGLNDMLLLAETCNFLAIAGMGKQRIDDENPPYRLGYEQPIWTQLTNILCDNFNKPVPHYDAAMAGAVRMIYYLCSKPDRICENILTRILELDVWNSENSLVNLQAYEINRFNYTLGQIAIYQLFYLDDIVYKELKRRSNKKSNNKNNRTIGNEDTGVASASTRRRANRANHDDEESILEGASADDVEADFILSALEHKIVTSNNSLGAFIPFFLEICENLNKFADEQVQCGAVLVLLRYMIVSSQMCKQHVQLIFKILANAQFVSVKRLILINLADLLARFPNLIDPYSSRIFERLKDNDHRVQKTTFFILANLLTRDMLRVNNKVYSMALPIVPESTILSDMSKEFFSQLGKKTHLYNILPDIFSYLCDRQELTDEGLHYIMKYLFDLIDKTKYMESLVERFCGKLFNNEDDHKLKHVGYCLTLIQYNDKAARKLIDNFGSYKDALHNADLNASFKHILAGWTKNAKANLKEFANELQVKIDEFFQIKDVDPDAPNETGKTPRKTARKTPRTARKSAAKSRGRPKKKRLSYDSSDEDDED